MFEHGGAVVGLAIFGHDRIVHDGEGDVVDHVIRDLLGKKGEQELLVLRLRKNWGQSALGANKLVEGDIYSSL